MIYMSLLLLSTALCIHAENAPISLRNGEELLLCRKCGADVADSYYLFTKPSPGARKSEKQQLFGRPNVTVQTLVNPFGVQFDIITTEKAKCDNIGPPQGADSWFPGFAWRICSCPHCGQHLGWTFEKSAHGDDKSKDQIQSFHGLILSNILGENYSGYLQTLIQIYDEQMNSQEHNITVTEDDQSTPGEPAPLGCNPQDVSITENNNENSGCNSLYIWNESCILLLLALYEEHKDDFANKRHKKIFDEIAKKMSVMNPRYTMSGGQCQSKLNSLKKTFKKILDHNSRSGNDRMTWPYFDRMNEIFGTTGWANPVATASEAGPASPSVTSNASEVIKKRKLDGIFEDFFKEKKKYMADRMAFKKESTETMIKIKQEQHREKMNVLQSLCSLLNDK